MRALPFRSLVLSLAVASLLPIGCGKEPVPWVPGEGGAIGGGTGGSGGHGGTTGPGGAPGTGGMGGDPGTGGTVGPGGAPGTGGSIGAGGTGGTAGAGGSGGTGGIGGQGGQGGHLAPFEILADYLVLIDGTLTLEGPVGGYILVFDDGKVRSDVEVRVNGVPIPYDPLDQAFQVTDEPIVATPGSTVVIEAEFDGQIATLALPCPMEVELLAPTHGSTFDPGTIEVRWEGKTHYDTLPGDPDVYRPFVRTFPYDWATHAAVHSEGTTIDTYLTASTTTMEVALPAYETDGAAVALQVAGDWVPMGERGGGHCALVRRAFLHYANDVPPLQPVRPGGW